MIPVNKYQPKKSSKKKRFIIIGIIVLVVAAAVMAALELTNTTHIFHKKRVSPHTSSQYTKGEVPSSSSNNSSSNNAAKADDREGDTFTNTKGQSDTPPAAQTTLTPITGNFASAHHISLATNPPLQSSCSTTPKATCQITFTNGSKTVQLKQQTTDDGGGAYWTWKPQDIGLTTGSWKIQAKAELNGKTITADDAMNLEVTP
jgi:flagellar basal body-associated protein FliL